jgi:FkbM family methyltransferase
MQGMKGDRNFKGFECALGASDGAETFNRSEMTQSSSFLPQLGSFKEAFPEVGSATSVPVRIRTLDGMRNEVPIRDNLLVKIDTQGFEDKVIAGGRATIRRARVAIIEVSFVPLYDGQPLFPDIYEAMKGLGHTFAGVLDVMRDPRTSRVLQADAVFMGGDAGNSG